MADQFPGTSKFRFSDFAVTPGGDVYVLGGMEGKTLLLRFDDDDANFYLAEPNQILVIAQDRSLLERIPFDNPYSGSMVTRLLVSGGLVIVVLSHVDDHQVHSRYLVLLNSGGVVGYYEPSEQLGGWPAMCYSPIRV